ncbi:MAG TPA: SusC/RagA family TonB-linked outer membrane protein, partial [Flavobacterium sp.]
MRSKCIWILTLLLALTVNFSFAQEKIVSGTVSDGTGPLPALNVVVKGTTRGVQTDFDGKYAISAKQGDVLEFSYVGYQTREVTVGASNSINVVMEADAEELIEVVVQTAYNTTTTSRRNVAAITTVSGEVIEERANASILQSLQGQVAGLNISTGSGQPGADSTIILRGVGSINGNIEPLFVIDGVPVDEDGFRSLNPNDIASFSILKDASATSIYGNRGANGVILVKTKQGKFNQPLQFRYTSQYGQTKLQKLTIELMSSNQFLNIQKQYGQGYGATLTDAEIAALSAQTNTYWSDIFFRTGTTQSHDLAITSGSENFTNFTSLGYMEQEGIFINTDFNRFTVRNNFTGKSANDKFHYNMNMNINFSRSDGIDGSGSNAIFFAPFTAALLGLPYLNPYDPDGSITHDGGITPGDANAVTPEYAPIVLLNSSFMNTDREDELKILTSFSADYEFAKNLTAGVQLGVDYSNYWELEILHPNSILGPFQVDQDAQYGGIHSEAYSRDFRFNAVSNLSYSNTFAEKHTIDVGLYTEYNKSHFEGFNLAQRGLDPRLVGTGAAFIPGTTVDDFGGTVIETNQPYIPTIGSFTVSEG